MARLNDELKLGNFTVRNRMYRAPVLEGAGKKEDAAAMYLGAFEPNAKAGVGLIIQGNSIVWDGGQTSPGMITTEDRGFMHSLRPMTDKLHEQGARIVVQLGHGGIYCLSSWSRIAREQSPRPILAPSPLPFPLSVVHPGVHVLTTDEVYELADRFGESAKFAREAGYDGVQLASSNAKLLHQFLTPIYNRREDEFGGSLEKRMRLMGLIRERIAAHAGADYPVLFKVPMLDHRHGITLEDGIEMARIAESQGFAAITPVTASHMPSTAICRGDFPAASYRNPKVIREYTEHIGSRWRYELIKWSNWYFSRKHGFEPLWNREVIRATKAAVNVPVFGVGGVRDLGHINTLLGGEADMVGVGRPFYAEPELPRRLLAGDERQMACASCNRCIVPQMLGWKGVCYNPEVPAKRKALNH